MRNGSADPTCCCVLRSTALFQATKRIGTATAGMPIRAISRLCLARRRISKVFYDIKLSGGALVDQARHHRPHVGGPLAEPAHEIREPLAAERDVEADARAAGDQRLLEVAPDAVEQLELVLIMAYA